MSNQDDDVDVDVDHDHDDDDKPRTTTATSTSTTSCLNTVLSSMILISLGAIGGFGIFHSALHHRYVDRMQRTEESHNTTLAMVHDKFVEAEQERTQCIETDDGRLQELSELRGRLEAQHKSWYDLTAAQRSLMGKHQESTAQVQHLQELFQQEQRTLEDLKVELEQKDRDSLAVKEELERNHRARLELESEVSKMKELAAEETHELRVRIQQKDNELEDVKKSYYILLDQKTVLETATKELKVRIQQMDDELESVKKNYDSLFDQKTVLEKTYQVSNSQSQQKDVELLMVRNNSQTLKNQKNALEEDMAGMKYALDKMQSQIIEKDEELFASREEEGSLETKLVNLREGMLSLLKEKINEIQDLENHVDVLNQEKAELELKLENWREGMLGLVKEKMQESEQLKAELADSQESMESMMTKIASARSNQAEAEESVKRQMEVIDQEKDEESIKELRDEIEEVKAQLRESQEWVEAAMKQIEAAKSDQAESEKLITKKMNEIEHLKSNIERDQESTVDRISKYESDLTAYRKLVEEKTSVIEGLNSELAEFVKEINGLKSDLAGTGVESNDMESSSSSSATSEIMIDHVQQRDGVMCRQLFGKGPYYVKFVIRLPTAEQSNNDGDNNTVFFVIEISSRKQLPHSAYTFLTLVESNLYNDGAAFLSTRDGGGLQIGSRSPDDHGADTTISLEQKLKPLGLTGGSSLSFVESSTSGNALPCGEFSFGFVHRGPGLNLFLSNTTTDEIDCFAQVIRGQESIHQIQSLLLESGEPAEILSVTHLRVN